MSSSDILCEICRSPASKEPNEIVICDRCQRGYHQLCHTPQIPSAILVPDLEWVRHFGTFFLELLKVLKSSQNVL